MLRNSILYLCLLVGAFVLLPQYGCQPQVSEEKVPLPSPDPGNGGIQLPPDFGAVVVADSLGRGRHLAVNHNGDVYVHLRRLTPDSNAIMALRDTTGDGKADVIAGFSRVTGTGIRIHNDYLYYSDHTTVYRSPLQQGVLLPTSQTDTLVHLVEGRGHIDKPFTFDGKGNMYVNVGSMSNACQEEARTPGSPGINPCVELETRAGIWRFSDSERHQQQSLDKRYATGIRNAMGLAWSEAFQSLYAVSHGRDDLHRFWPDLFTEAQNVELPAEEFLQVSEGDDFGWPYCYYDHFKGQKLLNPEYGGNGVTVGICAEKKKPIMGFPGHWAPNDLLFYTGDLFPERYKNGAFIAFHGSWNRLGTNQAGFCVVFVPMQDGKPSGNWEVFADGFVGAVPVTSSNKARYRPCGLAQGPDGSLYVVDSQQGRVWRIMYYEEGLEEHPASEIAEAAIDTTQAASAQVPEALQAGKQVYDFYCMACHQDNGLGVSGMNPPLAGTDWVTGDKQRLIRVILNGMNEPIEINGETYQNAMASHRHLTDQQIADVLTYIRQSFGNNASAVSPEEVAAVRAGEG
ncbi:MAG: cytochrome C [Bacteroidetes bacterium]|nr:MAG: cytochrome C [Bacteroidota bacterium]